jgi:hypothetical protein
MTDPNITENVVGDQGARVTEEVPTVDEFEKLIENKTADAQADADSDDEDDDDDFEYDDEDEDDEGPEDY